MVLASFRRITILALLGLFVGCSGSRQYQMALDAMRSEMLAVEDRYYNLEHEFRIQQAELDRYRDRDGGFDGEGDDDFEEEDDTLPQNFDGGDFKFREDFNPGQGSYDSSNSIMRQSTGIRRGNPNRSRSRGSSDVTNPTVTLPSNAMSADEFMRLLEGDTGSDSSEETGSDDLPLNGNRDSQDVANSGRDGNHSDRVPAREISDHDPGRLNADNVNPGSTINRAHEHPAQFAEPNPTHLVINPLLTRGRDFDGADGDDGFGVVVETRNADDLFVPAVGELVVSVLDPAEEGEAQRVGIWHYSPADVAKYLKDVPGQGRGINLVIDFPGDPPRHRNLKIFVRFIDKNGKRLESSANLSVAIPGDGQTGWSIRSTPRVRERGSNLRDGVPSSVPQIAREPRVGASTSGLPPSLSPNPSTSTNSGAPAPANNPNRPSWSPNR